ncbi:IPT/TIG domain-containing protein [Ectothiorhodospiraceae bacterium 2226]|nr:IPT/TIG domain-containing protein [Ectothiorhodospiraceae bacterium 2226]
MLAAVAVLAGSSGWSLAPEAQLVATFAEPLKGLALDQPGERALVLANERVHLVDLSADAGTSVDWAGSPALAAVADRGRGSFVIADQGNRIHFVSAQDLQPIHPPLKLAPLAPMLRLDPERGMVVAPRRNGRTIFFVDAVSGMAVSELRLDGTLQHFDVHPESGKVLLLERPRGGARLADRIVVVDIATQTVDVRTALAERYAAIAVSDTQQAAVMAVSDARRVDLLDLASRQVMRSYDTAHQVSDLILFAGGNYALLLDERGGYVSVLDLETGDVHAYGKLPEWVGVGVSARYNQALFAVSHKHHRVVSLALPSRAPSLSWIDPDEVLEGAQPFELHLHGSGFVDGAEVMLDEERMASRWMDATYLTVEVPADAVATAGVRNVSVENPGPVPAPSNALVLTVRAPNPVPVIDALHPSEIETGEIPVSIALSGSGFIGESNVYAGAEALETVYVSEHMLEAVIPSRLRQDTGTLPLMVVNPPPGGGASNVADLTVSGGAPTVADFSPQSGSAGTLVTIRGSNFDAIQPGANTVRFAGTSAVVASASGEQLRVVVPLAAVSGPITVSTSRGSATSDDEFLLQARESFDVVPSADSLTVPAGGDGSLQLLLESLGAHEYSHLVDLSFEGLPAGLTPHLSHGQLSLHQPTVITLQASGDVAPGTYQVTVTASGLIDGRLVHRHFDVEVALLPPGTTTLTGRVLQADDDTPFEGALIRLGEEVAVTDASGRYLFLEPQLTGDQVILIDGHTRNTDAVHYASSIVMPVMIEPGKANRAITSYLSAVDATSYTEIAPGQAASVTHPALENYELRIPEGAVLWGWDGTPIDKINVRVSPPDRLPIRPVPEGVTTRSVYLYYFFRAGGAEPTVPIPVTMANDVGLLPGEKADLWYYDETPEPDPDSNQWRIMGQGTVSEDGKRIVSDPGVGIPRFCCGASFPSPPSPPDDAPGGDGCGPSGGNPVDLASGIGSLLRDKGLRTHGPFSAELSFGYSGMTGRDGPLGLGTWASYEWRMILAGAAATVVTPQGIRYTLSRGADGAYRAASGRAAGLGMEATVLDGQTVLRFPDGRRFEFSRIGVTNGLLTAMVDARGNRTTLVRDSADSAGRLLEIRDPAGQRYRFDYESINRLAAIRDPLGRVQAFDYDNLGRLRSITDFLGQTTTYHWDAASRINQTGGPAARPLRYEYDDDGRVISQRLPSGDASSVLYDFEYQLVGRTVMGTTVRNPKGHITSYRFNGQGYITRVTDALGGVTETRYDNTRNVPLWRRDATGRTTYLSHDERGNVTGIRDVRDRVASFEYHPRFDKPTRIVDTAGRDFRFDYTSDGALRRAVDPLGNVHEYQYDSRGLMTQATDPLGNALHFQYDERGYLSSFTDSLGHAWRFAHDAAGRLVAETDPLGHTSRYTYDDLDRLIQIQDARGGITTITYTPRHKLATVRNPSGALIETNTYDVFDRLIERRDAAGNAWHYERDQVGNITTYRDPQGRSTHFQYDPMNRLTQASYPDGRTTIYVYDAAGRLAHVFDNESGEARYEYDDLDRLVREISDRGMIEYAYDDADQVAERRINGTEITAFSYDGAGRVTHITHNGRTARYDWDAAGRLNNKHLPNGLTQAYEYDAASRLTAIRYLAEGQEVDAIEYGYDPSGRIIQRRHSHGLTVADTPFTATYDADNRLTTFNGHALHYDPNGNLVERETDAGSVYYTWDAGDRLIAIQGPHGYAAFRYDHAGRRIEKTVNGHSVQYLYDGLQAVAELQGGALGAVYHTGLMIDEVLARYSAEGDRAHLTDLLGSVLALTDEDGSLLTRYHYSPYGEVHHAGEDNDNPLQYTGRENDQTGLYYYRARYYDPVLKRFVSRDPIGLEAGLNFYGYVLGDPINFVDPDGLRSRGTNQSIIRHYQRQIERKLEPVSKVPRQEYSIADILPSPSDWHHFYKNIDFGENCKVVCDRAGLMSCPASGTPYMTSCRVECR